MTAYECTVGVYRLLLSQSIKEALYAEKQVYSCAPDAHVAMCPLCLPRPHFADQGRSSKHFYFTVHSGTVLWLSMHWIVFCMLAHCMHLVFGCRWDAYLVCGQLLPISHWRFVPAEASNDQMALQIGKHLEVVSYKALKTQLPVLLKNQKLCFYSFNDCSGTLRRQVDECGLSWPHRALWTHWLFLSENRILADKNSPSVHTL